MQFAEVSGGFKAASLEAVHQASIGVDEQFAGKFQEAFDSFQKARNVDPKLTWAYTGMAAMAQNMGRPEDAVKYMQQAMQYVDDMTEREQFRDRGLYYRVDRRLAELRAGIHAAGHPLPSGSGGPEQSFDLLYAVRNAPKALEAARRAVEIVPKGVGPRLNLAFISAFAGDFVGSEREARTALSINPKAAQGYLVLAEAQLGQGQSENASQSYKQLASFGPDAASTAATGLADLAAYQDKHAEATSILEQSAAADLAGEE